MDKNHEVKQKVQKAYSKIATNSNSCCCQCGCGTLDKTTIKKISQTIGYTDQEQNAVPDANLGLGCGNPTAFSNIKQGDTILDLGSGAGFDCFLAAKKTGATGKVIGLDMTPEMIKKAQALAKKHGYINVEFRLGDIEKMPIDTASIDVIISNCVINLAPDKSKVFAEAHRVLKAGGKMFVSDIVLLGQLSVEQQNDDALLSGCVAGALQKDDYINKIVQAGFKVKIIGEDKEISKTQYSGLPLESLKIEAEKRNGD